MTPQRVRIFLQEQAPAIGCGWRYGIVRIGRKWRHFEERGTGKRARFGKVKWSALHPTFITGPAPKRRRPTRR